MKPVRVKICGLSRAADIEAVNRVKPDYCGFVAEFPKSRRSVSADRLRALRAELDDAVAPVGVFVDAPPALVAGLLNDGTLAAAQLHGSEDAAYIAALRALTGGTVWQAFRVRSAADVARAAESCADFVLLDAGQGCGKVFDWRLLRGFPRPFGLAGGLTPDAVPAALETGAALLDVSGGVETDGRKDPGKIRDFVERVRSACV